MTLGTHDLLVGTFSGRCLKPRLKRFWYMDAHLLPLGNLFDFRKLSDELRWLYEIPTDRLESALGQVVSGSHTDKTYTCALRYYSHRKVNASARDLAPAGCSIAISSSTPILVLMACIQMAERMNPRTALPNQDDLGRLIVFNSKPVIATSLASPITSESDIEAVLGSFARNHQLDNMLGHFLCEIVLKYIAMHECMHVVLGHTSFIADSFGLGSLEEFSALRDVKLNTELSQTLEFIADRHTVRGLYHLLLRRDYDTSYQDELLAPAEVDEQIFLLHCLMHALCVLYHLFPKNEVSIRKATGSHPHPYLRGRWMCHEIWQELPQAEQNLPLIAMSWAAANLSSNFLLPANWAQATIDDFDEQSKVVYSDCCYEQMLEKARVWQSIIYRAHGPKF